MAQLYITEVLAKMESIIDEHPSSMEYETDARDILPKRWKILTTWLNEKNKPLSDNQVSKILNVQSPLD